MSSHIDKNNGAIVVSHELHTSYCICEDQIMEREWPHLTPHCAICGYRCPNEEAIHEALSNSKMQSIVVLRRRRFKTTKSRSAKIEAVLTEGLGKPNVKALMDLYDTDIFRSVIKRLWMRGQFGSNYTAQSLDCDIPEHDAKEKPIGEKPAEDTPERSDWELLVPADAPAEASAYDPEEEAPVEAAPAEEAPAAYEVSPEEELPTAEACPVEAYDEDPPAEAKPTEVEETCEDDYVPEEQDAIYLPFSSQHKLMILLQEVLEGACFAYGQKKLPTLLREHGWNCVEAVALRTWMDQFLSIQHTFDTEPSRDLLQSVIGIQDTVVNRTPIGSSSMKKFLDDAVELTEILKMKDYGDIVKKVRLDIGKAIEDLSREEQEAEDKQDKKLKRIAEERMKLDEREAEARQYGTKDKRECQESAQLKVKKLLNEAKKSLETTTFFM